MMNFSACLLLLVVVWQCMLGGNGETTLTPATMGITGTTTNLNSTSTNATYVNSTSLPPMNVTSMPSACIMNTTANATNSTNINCTSTPMNATGMPGNAMTTAKPMNVTAGPLLTNPTGEAPLTNPTGEAPLTNPTGEAPLTNPTGGAPLTNPTGGAPLTNPTGGPPPMTSTGVTQKVPTGGLTGTTPVVPIPTTPKPPTDPNQILLLEFRAMCNISLCNVNASGLNYYLGLVRQYMIAPDFQNIPSDVLRQVFLPAQGDPNVPLQNFMPNEQQTIVNKIISTLSNTSTWNTSDLVQNKPILPYLGPNQWNQLNLSVVQSNVQLLTNLSITNVTVKMAVNNLVASAFPNTSAIPAEQVANVLLSQKDNPNFVKGLTPTQLQDSLTAIANLNLSGQALQQIGQQVQQKLPQFKNASTCTASDIADAGPLMAIMPPSFFKNVSPDVMKNATATLKNVDLPRDICQTIVENLLPSLNATSTDPTVVTSITDTIKGLGKLASGIPTSTLQNLPPAAIGNVLATLGAADFNPLACRAIVDKAKAINAQCNSSMGKLQNCMTVSELSDCSSGLSDMSVTSNISPALASQLTTTLLSQKGDLGTWNLTYFEHVAPVIALGLSSVQIQGLPSSASDLVKYVVALSPSASDMSSVQCQALSQKIISVYNLTSAPADVDGTVFQNLATFLTFASNSTLQVFSGVQKAWVAQKAGQDMRIDASLTQRRLLATLYLENVLQTDGTYANKRLSGSSISATDLLSFGTLVDGLLASDVAACTTEAALQVAAELNQVAIENPDVDKAVLQKVQNGMPSLGTDSTSLVQLGRLLSYANSSFLASLDPITFSSVALSISSNIIQGIKYRQERMDLGFTDLTLDQLTAVKSGEMAVIQKVIDTLFLSTPSVRRKKRTTTSISCNSVNSLGGAAIYINASLLSTLIDFSDCASSLGALTGWSSDQLTALVTLATTAWGSSLSAWTSSQITSAGTILAGLTSTQLQQLTISTDTVSEIGGYQNVFNQTQMTAVFSTWLSQTYGASAQGSSITGNDLVALGTFSCGATVSVIQGISASSFSTAAATIGENTKCGEAQKTAFAVLATSAFGSVTSWTPSQIQQLGVVTGGLTSTQLATLSQTQIQSIDVSVISTLATAKFASFSATQLGYLSSSQAAVVTAAQSGSLSAEQKAALSSAASGVVAPTPKDTTNGNSHGVTILPGSALIYGLLLTLTLSLQL